MKIFYQMELKIKISIQNNLKSFRILLKDLGFNLEDSILKCPQDKLFCLVESLNLLSIYDETFQFECINDTSDDGEGGRKNSVSSDVTLVQESDLTLMLRNIPNKYTSMQLLQFLNICSFGNYDFFYLRMDFKNRCNVGYAFINFISHATALDFMQKVKGNCGLHSIVVNHSLVN